MTGLRENLCYQLSHRLMEPLEFRNQGQRAYDAWRDQSLMNSWRQFDDALVTGRDVVDFGCGSGSMTFFLARRRPRLIVGVDLQTRLIERCRQRAAPQSFAPGTRVDFVAGRVEGLPLPDRSFDTILAFDCMEHVMDPQAIAQDWFRVLRPGGVVALEWYPFLGPWGPHMESLVPIPWAHILFGEKAMFRTAERIYDDPGYHPRMWDLDDAGNKKPNKWRQWSSFEEQGYLNELRIDDFKTIVTGAGFRIRRFETTGFSSTLPRRLLGGVLCRLPLVHEFFTSHLIIELERPHTS